MEQRLKQRLIGAVVLVALAVIFVPLVLQGPVERPPTDVPIEIPPKPAVNVPQRPAADEQAGAPAVSAPFTSIVPPADSPSRTPTGLAAWAVQVGSFGAEANAQSLRDQLRSKGYAAYTEAVESDGKTFYRVRVGPTAKRENAEHMQAALAAKESLEGLVVSHP